MPHWKSMMDRRWLFAFDLGGKDATLTIERVTKGEVQGEQNQKSNKPICYFKGRDKAGEPIKPLALNVTNCKTIAGMYGNDTDDWAGKRVTLFPTTTRAKGGEEVECIRVRPRVPPERAERNGAQEKREPPPGEPAPDATPPERQPGED